MLVASHTAVPIGTANGWEWGMQQMECPAVGRGHDEPYRLPMAGFPSRSIPFPAISVYLTADLYGWLLTSDAYRHLFHPSPIPPSLLTTNLMFLASNFLLFFLNN